MSADGRPFGELGDLAEDLVPIAADLVAKSHDEGPDAIRGCLLRVKAMEKELSPAMQQQLQNTPGGIWGAFAIACAAMVDPDAGMKQALGWTEPLVSLHVLQTEQDRLRAAGVKSADTAATLAEAVAPQQEGPGDRMLRVMHGGKASA